MRLAACLLIFALCLTGVLTTLEGAAAAPGEPLNIHIAFAWLDSRNCPGCTTLRLRLLVDEQRVFASSVMLQDYADLGYLGPQKLGTNNWPETLEILVEGVKLPGPDGKKMRFLRRIPVDPFTGKAEWGLRSDQDDPKSLSWGGQCVFDVYSKTQDKAPDGTPYSEWQ